MEIIKISAAAAAGIYLFLLLLFAAAGRKPIKTLLYNALSGIVLLAALFISRKFTGVYIPINAFTAGVCAAGGIAGAALVLTLNLIF